MLTHLFPAGQVTVSPVLGMAGRHAGVTPVCSPCYKAMESIAALGEMGEQ